MRTGGSHDRDGLRSGLPGASRLDAIVRLPLARYDRHQGGPACPHRASKRVDRRIPRAGSLRCRCLTTGPNCPRSGAPAPPLLDADIDNGVPGPRDDTGRFLERVYQAVTRGDVDRATDEVFDRMDGLLEEGNFAACDCILQQADLDRLDSNLMVAFLVITLPAREHLRERGAFYRGVERILTRDRGTEAVEKILRGLE